MSRASFLSTFFLLFLYEDGSKASEVHSLQLRNDGKTNVQWIVDYKMGIVEFEIQVPLNKTSWFAFGYSDYGSLNLADFCVFWTDWTERSHLEDVWTDEDGKISVDIVQNCEDFQFHWFADCLTLTFTRKFDTCDPQDYIIEDGTTHIVWAEGNGLLYDVNGINVNSSVFSGFERTQILKPEIVREPLPKNKWTLEVLADNVQVPASETTYWCHVQKLPQNLTEKNHVIQYEAVIQKQSEHLVHHMEVFHCEGEGDMPIFVGSCFDENRPEKTRVCSKVIAAWAMGAGPFSYPKEAGLPVGGPKYNLYVMLEIHYNNPDKITSVIDSSGIRFHLTRDLRQYDAGVIELGLEYTDKMAIPPGQPAFPLTSYCIAECTAASLSKTGLVIFASQLHTHLLGIKVYTKHVRNGIELPELNRDNHYSMHFQEIRRLKRNVRILPMHGYNKDGYTLAYADVGEVVFCSAPFDPKIAKRQGDALITVCVYKSLGKKNVTLGGFSITDEMCVNYVHYYPKTDLEVCKSSLSYGSLFSYFDYLKKFEDQNTDSRKPISDNYKAIDWTPLRVEVLTDLYTFGDLSMQCNRSSGERFPGEWEGTRPTEVKKPIHTPRLCPLT